MNESHPAREDYGSLASYDTPTICNALEVLLPERRSSGFTTRPFVCADAALPPMVGFARTATIRAVAAPPLSPERLRQQRAAYYEYLGEGPGPTIAVLQDLDPEPGFGAFWGEVNSNIHKALGCLGTVTNGSFRDLDDLAAGFQILGGMVAPSHAHVHVADYGNQVNVHGMTVCDGDLIHADRHGAVVIPASAVAELPAAVELVVRREKVILEACKRPDFAIGMLKQAMAESAEIH
jgi:hypothetical protein